LKLSASNAVEAGFIFAFVFNGFFGFSRLNSSSFHRWHPACKGSCQAGGKIRRLEKEQQN
jgi:putative flippase GtrA